MGSGKTTWALNEINAHPERLYLCIVPLRTEIQRYIDNIRVKTYTPINFDKNRRKLDNLKELITMGVNIVSTHALFLNIDAEVIELLKSRNYHLILDEALSVVSVISTGGTDDDGSHDIDDSHCLKPSEVKWLLNNKCMEVLSDNSVRWLAESSGYHRYQWVENFTNNGALSQVNDSIIIWCFPPVIFTALASVTILTYLFHGSLIESYMQAYKLRYEIRGLKEIGDSTYTLTDYNPEQENRQRYKELINICSDDSLNAIGGKCSKSYPLSKTWFKKNSKGKKTALKTLKDNSYNFLRHKVDATRESVMWTTFKSYQDKVCPKSYKTIDESRKILTFLPCNAKATNDYGDRYNLVYLCDRHINPNIVRFFESHNVKVDGDNFALSELLQWIWRSRIRNRDGDKNINLYLPSEHMRRLLFDYLSQ